jgi:hypothetical protein
MSLPGFTLAALQNCFTGEAWGRLRKATCRRPHQIWRGLRQRSFSAFHFMAEATERKRNVLQLRGMLSLFCLQDICF